MKNVFNKIKRLYKQLAGRLPSPLPVGINEFNAWCDDIKATYDLPTQSDDDIRFTCAAVIMRFNEIADAKPKYFFVRAMRSGAAKQIAGYAFGEVKNRQQAAYKAAQEAANVPQTSEA